MVAAQCDIEPDDIYLDSIQDKLDLAGGWEVIGCAPVGEPTVVQAPEA